MKKIFRQTLAVILAMATVFGMCVFANASEIGGSWWTFDEETGHLTVHANVPYNDNFRDSEIFRYARFIKSVSVDEGVTAIEKNAFRSCSKIEKIQLPQTLTFIGPWAFSGCNSLKEIELPLSLTYIGTYAFSNCGNLENIVIPPNVTVVSEYAFYHCPKLEGVEIMNGKTAVCGDVFGRNDALKTVRLPENADIDTDAFKDSYYIETVYYSGDEASYNALEVVNSSDNPFFFAEIFYNQPAAVYPVGISVSSMPQRTIYALWEELDPAGLELAFEMSDGTVQNISDLSQVYIRGFDSSCVGEKSFIVECCGCKAAVPYTVVEAFKGCCGKNMNWKFDEVSGTLEILNGGFMYDYNPSEKAPWYEFRDLIKTVIIAIPVRSIGEYAFYGCNEIESVYYQGNISGWGKMTGNKEVFRNANLYIQNELHEHSYDNYILTVREQSCKHEGEIACYCECGDFYSESLPVIDHILGDWETGYFGDAVRRCTMCGKSIETKEEEPEEIPEEEITQPETEPEEESKNVITEIFETIGSFFKKIFSNNVIAEFFANLFR